MSPDPAFRLDVRLRNNRLIKARERLGYANVPSACEALGLQPGTLYEYESLKKSPIANDGTWKESALKIADALFSDPEDLWPKEALRVSKARFSLEVGAAEVASLMGDPPERKLLAEASAGKVRAALQEAMSGLSPREEKVLMQTIVDGKTLDEVAKSIGRSRERVRAIRERALRDIRLALQKKSFDVVPSHRLPGDDGDPRPV